MPCGFRQDDIFQFPYISLCRTCDPRGVAIFLAQGDNLNKVGRSLLGDATHQISMSRTCGSETKIFKVFLMKIYFSLFDLDMQWTKTI